MITQFGVPVSVTKSSLPAYMLHGRQMIGGHNRASWPMTKYVNTRSYK
jgi:hypothetical protein